MFKMYTILNCNALYLCYLLLVILKLFMLVTSTFHLHLDPESGKFDILYTTNLEQVINLHVLGSIHPLVFSGLH